MLQPCTKFRGKRSRDFGFRTRKLLRKLDVKSGLLQKWLKYGKKYFTPLFLICLKISFHPNQPSFGRDEVFLFFPFFTNLVRSSKPQNIKIQFLCKVVKLQTQFVSKIFWGRLRLKPPQNGPQKNQFFNGLS